MNQPIKVAQIFSQYNHPVQPYLASWSQGLESESIEVGRFDLIKNHGIGAIPLGSKNTRDKIWKFIKYSIHWPIQLFRWMIKPSALVKARAKASIWSEYAPLIVFEPDVIHLVNSFLFPKFSGWINLLDGKLIVSFRGYDTVVRPWVDKEWRIVLQDLYQKADKLHFVSEYLFEEGVKLGAPSEKSIVIYPSVDIDFFDPSLHLSDQKKGVFTLVTVGRLTWQKGYPTALEAIKLTLEHGLEIQYLIVGKGEDEGYLDFLIRMWGLENHVFLEGSKSRDVVRDILHKCDLYIHPSITEAIPVAIMEACAMKCPVIATNVGGIPELIKNNDNGILIPPNDPRALADAIESMYQNTTKRNKMADQGRIAVLEKFSLSSEIDHWNKSYRNK